MPSTKGLLSELGFRLVAIQMANNPQIEKITKSQEESIKKSVEEQNKTHYEKRNYPTFTQSHNMKPLQEDSRVHHGSTYHTRRR